MPRPVNFAKCLRTPFFMEHLGWLLLVQLGKKCLQNFWLTKKGMMLEIISKSDCQITCYLFAGLKPIFLYSVYSIWFVKYVFSAEIWFVKTLTRIVKYKSRVVKSNPVLVISGNSHFSYIIQNLHLLFTFAIYIYICAYFVAGLF